MDDNITVSNVIHWEIMPGKYVLNFRHYRASDSEGVVHRLTEDQLINAIKYSIAQIDKNKLYAIQLNWSSSETSRKSVEKALKENTLLGGRYSAFDKKIQKIITKSFIQSPFIQKLCMQIDNLKMSCNFKSYFPSPSSSILSNVFFEVLATVSITVSLLISMSSNLRRSLYSPSSFTKPIV